MSAELEKEVVKWKKAFLDESNELAKRSTELNDLHDAYAILAEKYEAALASQARQPCTTCGGSGYSPPSTDSFLCQACSGKGYPPAPEGGDHHG